MHSLSCCLLQPMASELTGKTLPKRKGFGKVAWLLATFPSTFRFGKTLPVAKTPKVTMSKALLRMRWTSLGKKQGKNNTLLVMLRPSFLVVSLDQIIPLTALSCTAPRLVQNARGFGSVLLLANTPKFASGNRSSEFVCIAPVKGQVKGVLGGGEGGGARAVLHRTTCSC